MSMNRLRVHQDRSRTRGWLRLLAMGILGFLPWQLGVGQQESTATPENISAGRATYERSCAYCHGLAGDGEGPATPFLDVPPRDFTTGIYKFRSTASGQLPTDWDLMRTLTKGIHGTSMVNWNALAEAKRWQVVHYLKTFSDRFDKEAAGAVVAIGHPPGMTLERIQRGKQIYMDAECWQCHGYGGKGDGPSAPTLIDNFNRPIVPRDLTTGENFGRGHSPREIYQTLVTGIDGTPMPSYQDSFEGMEDILWDLVYYISFLAGED